jgi:predicted DNA-binding protein
MYVCLLYAYGMKRVAMFLTENQIKRLKQLSKTTGLKVSELIRRFIDRGLDSKGS